MNEQDYYELFGLEAPAEGAGVKETEPAAPSGPENGAGEKVAEAAGPPGEQQTAPVNAENGTVGDPGVPTPQQPTERNSLSQRAAQGQRADSSPGEGAKKLYKNDAKKPPIGGFFIV